MQEIRDKYPNLRFEPAGRHLSRRPVPQQASRDASSSSGLLSALGRAVKRVARGFRRDRDSEIGEIEPVSEPRQLEGTAEGATWESRVDIVEEPTPTAQSASVQSVSAPPLQTWNSLYRVCLTLTSCSPLPPQQASSSRRNLDKRKRFLLYLNNRTWLDAAGSELADQVPCSPHTSTEHQPPLQPAPARHTPPQPAATRRTPLCTTSRCALRAPRASA